MKRAMLIPWLTAIALLVVFVVGMTAIDKYDERTCIQSRGKSLWVDGGRSDCNGFLPW